MVIFENHWVVQISHFPLNWLFQTVVLGILNQLQILPIRLGIFGLEAWLLFDLICLRRIQRLNLDCLIPRFASEIFLQISLILISFSVRTLQGLFDLV